MTATAEKLPGFEMLDAMRKLIREEVDLELNRRGVAGLVTPRQLRADKKLGVNELALNAGVDAKVISKYENGLTKNPKPEIVAKIAGALNVDAGEYGAAVVRAYELNRKNTEAQEPDADR